MQVGVIHFPVCNINKSLEFYRDKLGLKCTKLLTELKNPWAELDGGGVIIGIQEVKEKFEKELPPWRGAMISFEVNDIENTKSHLEKIGVNFLTDIQEFGEVKVAKFEDPDGNPLEIHEWIK